MLRFLFVNQQRSFHQSAIRWNYSRTALRRLKKPELIALAGQHKLDSSGTKNDIIDRLLTTSPTDSTSSVTHTTLDSSATDPPTHSEKSAIRSTPIPPATTTTVSETEPLDTKLDMSTTETPSSSSSTTSPGGSTSTVIVTDTIEDNDEEYDQQWVEAFDLKVGNRRSGLNGLGARERSSSTRQEYNHNKHRTVPSASGSPTTITSSAPAASSSTHPAYVHQTLGVDPANNSNFINLSSHRPTTTTHDPKALEEQMEFTDPEINQHWVKVFDQRVKTRTKIMGLNTLDINPTLQQQQQPLIHNDKTTTNPGNNNKAIDIAIGTSLAIWYFLGVEGIQAAFSSFFS